MKKLLALLLSVVMVLSLFAACSSDTDDDEDSGKKSSVSQEKETKPTTENAGEKAVADYVKTNGAALIPQMEESFAASAGGLTCKADVSAEGCGIVIDIKLDDWNDVPQETKDQMQETYDGMQSVYDGLLQTMQTELPELEYVTYNICEEDGDIVASITAGNK